jgi:hypothetical protein
LALLVLAIPALGISCSVVWDSCCLLVWGTAVLGVLVANSMVAFKAVNLPTDKSKSVVLCGLCAALGGNDYSLSVGS